MIVYESVGLLPVTIHSGNVAKASWTNILLNASQTFFGKAHYCVVVALVVERISFTRGYSRGE